MPGPKVTEADRAYFHALGRAMDESSPLDSPPPRSLGEVLETMAFINRRLEQPFMRPRTGEGDLAGHLMIRARIMAKRKAERERL